VSKPLGVLFVCLHGAAKSVVATEYFRRLAGEAGADVTVASAGVEPDAEIPAEVRNRLAAEGFDVGERRPAELTAAALRDADVVVSFGCQLDDAVTDSPVIVWEDVPAVSDGYDRARDAIVARVQLLVSQLKQ